MLDLWNLQFLAATSPRGSINSTGDFSGGFLQTGHVMKSHEDTESLRWNPEVCLFWVTFWKKMRSKWYVQICVSFHPLVRRKMYWISSETFAKVIWVICVTDSALHYWGSRCRIKCNAFPNAMNKHDSNIYSRHVQRFHHIHHRHCTHAGYIFDIYIYIYIHIHFMYMYVFDKYIYIYTYIYIYK